MNERRPRIATFLALASPFAFYLFGKITRADTGLRRYRMRLISRSKYFVGKITRVGYCPEAGVRDYFNYCRRIVHRLGCEQKLLASGLRPRAIVK